jgi:transcriptional regulator with XRE-family HTH domain
MRHPAQLREAAARLRATQGLSLDEIAERLSISRSTVYYWVKETPITCANDALRLPHTDKQKANQRAATTASQEKWAARRLEAYNSTYDVAPQLLADLDIRDFVVLYLAEGYRKNRNTVGISNSNPRIMTFAHRCMRRLATNPHFYYSFQFHADQNPEQLKCFWASCLGIDSGRIKPIPKTNSGHLKGRLFNCEYGVFQIQVGDTTLRAQLQALMDVVQEQWAAEPATP